MKPKTTIIKENFYFSDVLKEVVKEIKVKKSFLEIGGFPGNYCIYVKKYLNLNPTLVDAYVNNKQITNNILVNGLNKNDIKIIKGDVFDDDLINQKFGIVFSSGFIEHFDDLSNVILRHVNLCIKGGYIIISVPNFLGINGSFQKIFDKKNLSIHNLKAMDIKYLKKVLDTLGIKKYKFYYYGHFGLWLENLSSRCLLLRLTVYCSVLLRGIFKKLKLNGKFISPFLLLIIKKD